MSKVLKIAAIVVGVAAIVVTGGAALGLIPAVGFLGLGISTALLGTILSVTATVLSLAAGVLAKPPKLRSSGQQLEWSADPASGEPYVIGDTMVGASIVHQASWGDKNKFLGIVGVLSVCTLTAYDGLYADMTQVTFSGRNATGYFHDFMYISTQLGALPEATALDMTAPDASMMPDWGSTYKTSGLGTVGLVMVADVKDGKVFSGGAPKLTNRVRGVKAYDARADSTVTGGSGAQRALNEATYAYSQNPWVHAETYALGRWQNGINVIGPGLPADKIEFASFMEAATIADANGWKVSGQVYSTDPKWDVLKAMAQAGGGVPMPTQARLSCLVNAPKVSLATITEADCKGPVSAPQMFTRRQRLNGAIPRYRSADHGWEIIPGDAVRNSTWLAADGGKPSTKEFEFALVADKGDGAGKTQAAQLAAYAVGNSRERGPISVELGYAWSQYKVGDCLTLNLPKARLNSQKCVVVGRSINIAKNTITLDFQTETDAKHAWALGIAGTVTAPPTVAQTPGVGDVATGAPALVGPAQANVFYDNAGTTFQSADDLNYLVQRDGATVTSGVTMTWTVLSGTFNGKSSADGAQSLTLSSGVGTITPSSLATDTASLKIDALADGVAAPSLIVPVAKVRAVAAPSGTGGGGAGPTDQASQSSGFTAINTASFTTITSSLTFTLPAGKTTLRCVVDLSCRYPKTADQSGPWDVEFKVQRGGVDQGATQHSSPDPALVVDSDGITRVSPGTMQYTLDMTSLTALTQYTVVLQARVASGTLPSASNMSFLGTVTLSAP